jgi:hypothetical protein
VNSADVPGVSFVDLKRAEKARPQPRGRRDHRHNATSGADRWRYATAIQFETEVGWANLQRCRESSPRSGRGLSI